MRRPLRSWKNLLGMLGLQVVERTSAPRPAKRQRSFESLEDRSMMATLYWDTNGTTPGLGGAGTWDLSAANWTSDPTGSSATQAWNNAAGNDAVFSGAGAAVTLGSGVQAASLKIEANGFTLGGGSLAVNGTGEVSVATGISTTISTQLTGSTELRKTGTGTLTLSGNNTLYGGSKLEAGTVAVNHNSALGTGTITLAGGKLQAGNGARILSNAIVAAAATTSEVVSPTNNNLTLNGNLSGTGTIWKTGAFSVFLGGDNSGFAGTLSHRQSNFYFNTATAASAAATWDITGGNQFAANFAGAGTLQFGSLAGTTGAIHGGGGSGAKVWEIGALDTSTSFAGTIAGSTVSLVKTGTGTLTLGGTNTFTAGSTLSNGTLIVTNNSALGTGAITLAGGKLQSGSAARTLSNSIVAATGTVSELISPTNFNLTLNGNLTGSGTILKSGGFSVFLGGDNSTFAGAFSNRQSNVFLNTPNSASALAAWDITGGDMLAMNFAGDGTVQLGSLAGTTGRIISGITSGTKTLEIGALNTTTTYNGTIQNHSTTTTATTVAVVKKGTGTLTLGGRNTFTNNLTIDAGTLVLANNNNDGTSKAGIGTITVRSGATLRVAGSNVFGTGANLPSEVALESGSTLDLIGAFYSQLPHVTMSNAAITSGSGNASYGSWAFMGGISGAGGTSTIAGQNMFIPGTVAIDVAAGATLAADTTFEDSTAYGESKINTTGAGLFLQTGNLVKNGSFELPNINAGSFSYLASVPGWKLQGGGTRFEIQDNVSGLGGAAGDTQQHLELDSTDSSSNVEQTINVIPGAKYTVSFAYRGRPNRSTADNKLKFELFDSNGTAIKTVPVTASNTNEWTYWTDTFTSKYNSVRLLFSDTGEKNSYGAFIDEVRLELVGMVDIDGDSNNDGQIDPNNSDTGLDDQFEENSPGILLGLNVAKELKLNFFAPSNGLSHEFVLKRPVSNIELFYDQAGTNKVIFIGDEIRWPTGSNTQGKLWIQAKSIGSGELRAELYEEGGAILATDRLVYNVDGIDLRIDSNNDGIIDEVDEVVEGDASKPGKVILVNSLDSTGNGIPDYADGIFHTVYGNPGPNLSLNFTPITVTIPDYIDLNIATLVFSYNDSDPYSVIRNGDSEPNTIPEYTTTSSGYLRLWNLDGMFSRDGDTITNGGNYISSDSVIKAKDLFKNSSRTVTLYVEGMKRTDPGNTSIIVKMAKNGDYNYVQDTVYCSTATIEIWYTDTSGLTHKFISGQPALAVDRIPVNEQPEAIATDWSQGVDDGASLLVTVLGSSLLKNAYTSGQPGGLGIQIGEIRNGNFNSNLIANNGSLLDIHDDANNSLDNNIRVLPALVGMPSSVNAGLHSQSNQYALKQYLYKPPTEYDLLNPTNTTFERRVNIAVKLTGVVDVHGSKVNGLALVRPAVVLVHGVNSNPAVWDIAAADLTSSGFKTYRADHHGVDDDLKSEKDTLGFGEVSHMYKKVKETINQALADYRNGNVLQQYVSHKRKVAIQKTDVVAHSYGGILTRWYTEMSSEGFMNPGDEYESQRNVRKINTLGTPHNGSPLANMVAAIYTNQLIRNAHAQGFYYGWQQLDDPMIEVLKTLQNQPNPDDRLPSSLDDNWDKPRHAYQVFSVNSQRLSQLNSNGLNKDIAYRAMVGEKTVITEYNFNPFSALRPNHNPWGSSSNSYFPWIYEFNSGSDATDGIVPVWSAMLGGPGPQNSFVEANHLELTKDETVLVKIKEWLNAPSILGSNITLTSAPISERNAYAGSVVGPGGISINAGLNPDAIVGVVLPGIVNNAETGENVLDWTLGTPGVAGVHNPVLTGMIKMSRIGNTEFRLISDEDFDVTLHNLGNVTLANMNISASQKLNATVDDYVAYRIDTGKVGRMIGDGLTGPDNYTSGLYNDGNGNFVVYLGYESDELPDRQSPPVQVILKKYNVDPVYVGEPVIVSSTPTTYNISAYAYYQADSNINVLGGQQIHISAWDEDFFGDDLLVERYYQSYDANAWAGLLMMHDFDFLLHKDSNGQIYGIHGESGETEIQLYVELGGNKSKRKTIN